MSCRKLLEEGSQLISQNARLASFILRRISAAPPSPRRSSTTPSDLVPPSTPAMAVPPHLTLRNTHSKSCRHRRYLINHLARLSTLLLLPLIHPLMAMSPAMARPLRPCNPAWSSVETTLDIPHRRICLLRENGVLDRRPLGQKVSPSLAIHQAIKNPFRCLLPRRHFHMLCRADTPMPIGTGSETPRSRQRSGGRLMRGGKRKRGGLARLVKRLKGGLISPNRCRGMR